MNLVVDLASWILLVAGGLFSIVGTIGLLVALPNLVQWLAETVGGAMDQLPQDQPVVLVAHSNAGPFVPVLVEAARRPVADGGHLDRLVRVCKLRKRAGVLDLDLFRVLRRGAHRDGDVVGDLVAGDRQRGAVTDRALREHRDVGGAGADVDQRHAQFLLVRGQHRVARRQRAEDQIVDLHAGPPEAGDVTLLLD